MFCTSYEDLQHYNSNTNSVVASAVNKNARINEWSMFGLWGNFVLLFCVALVTRHVFLY